MRLQAILKEKEAVKIIDYCRLNHLSISAFIRSALCKKLDEEEFREKWNQKKK